ncbi:MAG: hydrogenase formation protein HypD [Elusimicrobiota bacterium]
MSGIISRDKKPDYSGRDDIKSISGAIAQMVKHRISFMEVCGTHTMEIARNGLRALFPEKLRLISGPGCPVCVTPQQDIDAMIRLAEHKDIVVATFGDMLRVPSIDNKGNRVSLETARAVGADVHVVYSPVEALGLALKYKNKKVVFLGVGFETTIPVVATTVMLAEKRGITNFFVYPAFKTLPQALRVLLSTKDSEVDGLILPGHVSVILGVKPYEFIPKEYGIPCVITGFTPRDIMLGVYMLTKQRIMSRAMVENEYTRAVKPEGNRVALKILEKVFSPCDSNWRGLGIIQESGLEFSKIYRKYDAKAVFGIKVDNRSEYINRGCICGEVIKGKKSPRQCVNLGKRCTPSMPLGPCMVSSEGSCAAYYKYECNN